METPDKTLKILNLKNKLGELSNLELQQLLKHYPNDYKVCYSTENHIFQIHKVNVDHEDKTILLDWAVESTDVNWSTFKELESVEDNAFTRYMAKISVIGE